MLCLIFSACDDPGDDNKNSGKATTAKLISSKLGGSGLKLNESVTLNNVTGLADSLGLNFTEDLPCGFHLWGANGQTSKSGLEGRSYEEFNLGDPLTWSSTGEGLQGDCESATVAQVESYFLYIDLHLSVGSEEKVIRVYLGDLDPFKAGDVALVDGSTLYWLDNDAMELVASTSTRPNEPKQITLPKEIPWYDNNGTEKIIMQEFRISVSGTHQVTKDTGHVTVDLDFSRAGISVGSASSDIELMNTMRIPLFSSSNTTPITAELEILEESRDDTDSSS